MAEDKELAEEALQASHQKENPEREREKARERDTTRQQCQRTKSWQKRPCRPHTRRKTQRERERARERDSTRKQRQQRSGDGWCSSQRGPGCGLSAFGGTRQDQQVARVQKQPTLCKVLAEDDDASSNCSGVSLCARVSHKGLTHLEAHG